MRKAFYILIIHDCFFPISCVLTSGLDSWKEKAVLFQFHLLSLSRWSPHLPQCQLVHSVLKCLSHCPCVIPKAPLNEGIVNGYRRHSQNSCSYLLPQGLNPNPQVNTCLQSLQFPLGFRCPTWMWLCTCCFLPQLGLPVTWRVSDWLTSVGCWDCLHVLDPDRL